MTYGSPICYPVPEGVDPGYTATALGAAATLGGPTPTGAPVTYSPIPAQPHRNELTKPQTPL
eukprot:48798-Heterocapsa_arctica.AAC.1